LGGVFKSSSHYAADDVITRTGLLTACQLARVRADKLALKKHVQGWTNPSWVYKPFLSLSLPTL